MTGVSEADCMGLCGLLMEWASYTALPAGALAGPKDMSLPWETPWRGRPCVPVVKSEDALPQSSSSVSLL